MLERSLAMKTILFASVAVLALAAAAPAFAQTPPAQTPPAQTPPAQTPPAEKPAAVVAKPAADKPAKPAKPTPAAVSAKDHTLAGAVKSFDADKHILTFASGKEFSLDASITDTFKAGKRMADKVTKG